MKETHYYPFGLTMTGISSKALQFGGAENKLLFLGSELQNKEFLDGSGLELYDMNARHYDQQLGRFQGVDLLSENFYQWSPYSYSYNNPLRFTDPSGLAPFSTHIDKDGNVLAVFMDGDKGVYQHGDNADGGVPTEYMLTKRAEKHGTSSGGVKIGETEYLDEFISPETGKTMTNYKIQVGKSFDPIISEMHAKAVDMNLAGVALESRGGGTFDIKKDYVNVGALLNGKYATSRSAGNFLAGYNAQGATYLGLGISFSTFQKLAGALHIEESHGAKLSKGQMADIVLSGNYLSADPDKHKKFVAPTYGEVNYQYRMSLLGWNYGKKN